MQWIVKHLRVSEDARGMLVVGEYGEDFDFPVKRFFFITKVPADVVRGKHSHKNLNQLIFCVSGHVTLELDDGNKTEIIELNSPSKAVWVAGPVWREMRDFSEDAVLMVLCDRAYEFDIVVYDRAEFLADVIRE